MEYITRISYNSALWRKPTGDAAKYEHPDSYNRKFGFGHEDWLFRDEWVIDGWRYAFLQGAGKSLKKLRKKNAPFDVRLFCIEPDKRRRYVADIADVECLSESHADEAIRTFERRGWLNVMRAEVAAIGGVVSALGRVDYATHILNIRYREDCVHRIDPGTYATQEDPVGFYSRYSLIDLARVREKHGVKSKGRTGSRLPPSLAPIVRQHVERTVEISPAHALMQAKLMAELSRRYPKADVVREQDCIDVILRTNNKRVLFEVKSSLSSVTTIRNALGQLFEYLYRVGPDPQRTTSLVIVGRTSLTPLDANYFAWLKSQVQVSLEYRVVEI